MKDALLSAMDYAAALDKVAYADIRAITSKSTVVSATSKEENVQAGENFGIGIRVLAGGMWGYSSLQSVGLGEIKKAVDSARKTALTFAGIKKERVDIGIEKPVKDKISVLGKESVLNMPFSGQRTLLLDILDYAKAKDIIFSRASLSASKAGKVFANTEGSFIETEIERTRLGLTSIARRASKQTMNYDVSAAQGGLEAVKRKGFEEFSRGISEKAVLFLSAKSPPKGKTTVLMSPQVAGTLIHEVFGHAAEADWVACGRSLLGKQLDQKIGADSVTIYDDGSIPGAWGSVYYDDEGTPCRKNTLMENGILKQYMHTRETAKKLGMPITGNGRMQDYTHMVIPRMTNTCLAYGDATLEEMISMVKDGIVVDKFTIALEDPAGGSFEIKTLGGHHIKSGKLAEPISRAAISSSSFIETLSNVVALSKKYPGDGTGMCGKGHENWVAVGNPAPYMLVKDLTVGGV